MSIVPKLKQQEFVKNISDHIIALPLVRLKVYAKALRVPITGCEVDKTGKKIRYIKRKFTIQHNVLQRLGEIHERLVTNWQDYIEDKPYLIYKFHRSEVEHATWYTLRKFCPAHRIPNYCKIRSKQRLIKYIISLYHPTEYDTVITKSTSETSESFSDMSSNEKEITVDESNDVSFEVHDIPSD